MASSTANLGGPVSPTITLEALEAITSRPADAPRRCFICLTDEEPSDNPSDWVSPCPCTLEAHQDCILEWVTDCERSSKPLNCPICKSPIHMEGPSDLLVCLSDSFSRRFTKVSPFLLLIGATAGAQVTLEAYGRLAMRIFSGKRALRDFTWDFTKSAFSLKSRAIRSSRSALILTCVAPALVVGQLLPNMMFLPTASVYGLYHITHDPDFVSWPPSPELGMAVFPYIRFAYRNLWRKYVYPYEIQLNRKLMGLPPQEPQRNTAEENRRNQDRNQQGGILGFLQNIIDALELDDDDEERANGNGELRIVRGDGDIVGEGNAQEEGFVFDIVIEQGLGDDDFEDPAGFENLEAEQEGGGNRVIPPAEDQEAPEVPEHPEEAEAGVEARAEEQHEAPMAPPVGRPSLGTIFSSFSNAIAGALILPGISFVMGEALRYLLPAQWTTFRWRRPSGFLQLQWGRSLVGGCLYVVLKDAVRLYSKHRKAAAMGTRKVKDSGKRRRR